MYGEKMHSWTPCNDNKALKRKKASFNLLMQTRQSSVCNIVRIGFTARQWRKIVYNTYRHIWKIRLIPKPLLRVYTTHFIHLRINRNQLLEDMDRRFNCLYAIVSSGSYYIMVTCSYDLYCTKLNWFQNFALSGILI